MSLNSYRAKVNRSLWVVIHQLEVRLDKVIDASTFGVEFHDGECTRDARELFQSTLNLVAVDMCIPSCPDERVGYHVHTLSDRLGKDRIRGDVEGNSDREIRTRYIQAWALTIPRSITCSCMSPCRLD